MNAVNGVTKLAELSRELISEPPQGVGRLPQQVVLAGNLNQ